MFGLFRLGDADWSYFKKRWGWFIALGILLIILGIIATATVIFTTLVSVIFLGSIILLGGIIIIIDAFTSWQQKCKVLMLHLLIGVLYIIAGVLVLKHPISASISLTLMLGLFYIFIGTFRLFYYIFIHGPNWGWGFFSGLVSLLLGFLIIANWPSSSLYIIGLFVGIDLIFLGWAYVMLGIYVKTRVTA